MIKLGVLKPLDFFFVILSYSYRYPQAATHTIITNSTITYLVLSIDYNVLERILLFNKIKK